MSDAFTKEMANSVAKAERERIIKLLETEPLENPRNYSDEDIWAFQVAIALIKGENK